MAVHNARDLQLGMTKVRRTFLEYNNATTAAAQTTTRGEPRAAEHRGTITFYSLCVEWDKYGEVYTSEFPTSEP